MKLEHTKEAQAILQQSDRVLAELNKLREMLWEAKGNDSAWAQLEACATDIKHNMHNFQLHAAWKSEVAPTE